MVNKDTSTPRGMKSIRTYLNSIVFIPTTLFFLLVVFTVNYNTVKVDDSEAFATLLGTAIQMKTDTENMALVSIEAARTLANVMSAENAVPPDEIILRLFINELEGLPLLKSMSLVRLPQEIPQLGNRSKMPMVRVENIEGRFFSPDLTLGDVTLTEQNLIDFVISTRTPRFSPTEELERDKHYVSWAEPVFDRNQKLIAIVLMAFGSERTQKSFETTLFRTFGADTAHVHVLVSGQYERVTYYSKRPSVSGMKIEEWLDETDVGIGPYLDRLRTPAESSELRVKPFGPFSALFRNQVWMVRTSLLQNNSVYLWGLQSELSPIDWSLVKRLTFLAVAFFLLQGIILLDATRRISHPIISLSETARQIGEGGLASIDFEDRSDELGVLARSMSEMKSQLRTKSEEYSFKRSTEFGSIVDELPLQSFYFRLDEKGSYTYVSNGVSFILGTKPSDLLGTPHLSDDEDHAATRRELDTLLSSGTQGARSAYHLKVQHPDASRCYLFVSVRLQLDFQGGKYLEGVAIDESKGARERKNLALIVQASPIATLIVAESGYLVSANYEACNLFGFEGDEVGLLRVEDLIPGGRASNHTALRESYFNDPRARGMQGRDLEAKRKDGTVFPAEIGLSPIVTDGGTQLVIATVRNITLQKQAIEEVQKAKIKLEEEAASRSLAMASADIGFFSLDILREERVWDESIFKIMGFLPDSPLEQETWFSAIHPDDREETEALFRRGMKAQESYDCEYRIVRPIDGKRGFIRESSTWITDEKGEKYLIGVIHDVTALREQEGHFGQLFDSPSDGVLFVHPESLTILEANKTFAAILGYAGPDEVIGKTIYDLSPLTQTNGMTTLEYSEFVDAEPGYGFEWLHSHADGSTVPCLISMSEGYFEGKTAFIAIVRDVSELHEATRKAMAAAASKAAFLANMSHEIRTPINVIMGFAEVLSEMKQTRESREYLSIIRSAGQDLLSLINDILDLSKIEADKMELEEGAVDLLMLVKEVENFHSKAVADKGLTFEVKVSQDQLPHIWTDSRRLRQVLNNLISNAIKFTHDGGVTLSLRVEPSDGENTFDIYFQVRDSGIGMDASELGRIFDSFEQIQGNEAQSGTGLGLAISLKLVRLMGGDISVSSVPGRGSVFTVSIPDMKRADDLDFTDGDESFTKSITFAPASVLIVDDKEENRRLIVEYLKDAALRVDTTESGKDALDIIRTQLPDLVLLDIKLNDMHGGEVMSQIRALPAGDTVTIVGLTASVEEMNRHDGVAEEMILKPVSKRELFEVMAKYLEHKVLAPADSKTAEPSSSEEWVYENVQIGTNEASGKLRVELVSELTARKNEVNDLLQGPSIDRVEMLGLQIIGLARRCGDQPLEEWATDLVSHANMVRIQKILKSLARFDTHIERLS